MLYEEANPLECFSMKVLNVKQGTSKTRIKNFWIIRWTTWHRSQSILMLWTIRILFSFYIELIRNGTFHESLWQIFLYSKMITYSRNYIEFTLNNCLFEFLFLFITKNLEIFGTISFSEEIPQVDENSYSENHSIWKSPLRDINWKFFAFQLGGIKKNYREKWYHFNVRNPWLKYMYKCSVYTGY